MTLPMTCSGVPGRWFARRTLGGIVVAASIGLLALGPTTTAAAADRHRPDTTAKCPVDHHKYASAMSASRAGKSVTVKAKLGKKVCGPDGGGYKFGKHAKTLTVHKGALVKVLKDIAKSSKAAKIPVRRLPHYVDRPFDKTDVNIFQFSGKRHDVKRFVQVFIS